MSKEKQPMNLLQISAFLRIAQEGKGAKHTSDLAPLAILFGPAIETVLNVDLCVSYRARRGRRGRFCAFTTGGLRR